MKIHGWAIDGFGIFRDVQVEGLGAGLTVFLGPNEAGKSTALAFLRGVFFGFPDGRSRELRYPPLKGGRHGGRVFVDGPDGVVTIEREAGRRRPPRVIYPDGQEGGEEDLRRLLGGADGHLFRSVFAFSLTELQTFSSLTAEGVRDRIFSAGIAGAGRSAGAVQKRLDDEMQSLLKMRGRAAELTQLVDELEENRRQEREAHALVDRYGEFVAAEARCADCVKQLQSQADAMRGSTLRLQSLIDLWPAWSEILATRDELKSLPAADQFPAEGDVRLAALVEKAKATRAELEELGTELSVDETQRKEFQKRLDPDAHAVRDEAVALHGELSAHRDRRQALTRAHQRQSVAASTFQQSLQELGEGYEPTQLEELFGKLPTREDLRGWDERIAEAREQVRVANAALEGRRSEAARAKEELEKRRRELPSQEPASRERLEGKEATVRRLRATLAEFRTAEHEAESAGKILADRQRELQELRAEGPWRPPSGIIALTVGLGLLAFVSAFLKFGRGKIVDALPEAILGALAVVGLLWYRRRVRHQQGFAGEREKRLEEEMAKARDAAKAQRAEVDKRRSSIQKDTAALSLESASSLQDVENKGLEVRRQYDARSAWDHQTARIAEAKEYWQQVNGEEGKLAKQVEKAQETQAKTLAEWLKWKREHAIPGRLTPRGAADFVEAFRIARRRLDDQRQAKQRTDQLRADVTRWDARVTELLKRSGDGYKGKKMDVFVGLNQLVSKLEDDRKAREQVRALEAEMKRRRARKKVAVGRLKSAEKERRNLFEAAGVKTEEAFRERGAETARRLMLEGRIEDRERQIAGALGQGPHAEGLRKELAGGKLESWQVELSKISKELHELQKERDEAIRAHRDAESARREIENSADVETLETQRGGLKTELERTATRWRVATLARALVAETLQEFENTRQPRVLSEASQILRMVTGKRYQQILQSKEGNDVIVVAKDGTRKLSGELSRGTAEQLYLALRLGLIAEYARRSVSLPLVMDDVLVNFDPTRARGMAKAFAKFAKEHQVFLFTCHPSTAELITDVAPSAVVRKVS